MAIDNQYGFFREVQLTSDGKLITSSSLDFVNRIASGEITNSGEANGFLVDK